LHNLSYQYKMFISSVYNSSFELQANQPQYDIKMEDHEGKYKKFKADFSRQAFHFFSRTRRRAAHQYIKKIKRRERAPKTKNVTGIKGL